MQVFYIEQLQKQKIAMALYVALFCFFVFSIYRNGDALSGKRVLIPSNIARSRDHVLELITNKAQLFTPAKRLCSLDGKPVEINSVENGGKYVAIEGSKTFQKVSYSIFGGKMPVVSRLENDYSFFLCVCAYFAIM